MVKKRTIITITEYENEKDEEDEVNGVFVEIRQTDMADKSLGYTLRRNSFIRAETIKISVLSKEELIKHTIDQLRNDIQKGE